MKIEMVNIRQKECQIIVGSIYSFLRVDGYHIPFRNDDEEKSSVEHFKKIYTELGYKVVVKNPEHNRIIAG